jgi:hypothetical protein
MTLPSASSDVLIFFASARVRPVAPERLTSSDPARSTRVILPRTSAVDVSDLRTASWMSLTDFCRQTAKCGDDGSLLVAEPGALLVARTRCWRVT